MSAASRPSTRTTRSSVRVFSPSVAVSWRVYLPGPGKRTSVARAFGLAISTPSAPRVTFHATDSGSGPGVIVQLQCGSDRLLARITRRSAEALGLKRADFAQILGVSEPTISRFKNGQSFVSEGKSFELSVLLIRVYRALYAIVGGDAESLRHWMKTPNRHFSDQVPTELASSYQGLAALNVYLDAMRGRV